MLRQTVDVDCLIAVENRQVLDAHLRGGGFERLGGTENFARYSHSSDLVPDVDVLFVDASTFDKLHFGSIPLQRGPTTLQAPSLPHLITLKLHAIRNNPARESGDLGGVVKLLRANPGFVPASELVALCARFGPPGIEAKLLLL
jgi:hypothetical protein